MRETFSLSSKTAYNGVQRSSLRPVSPCLSMSSSSRHPYASNTHVSFHRMLPSQAQAHLSWQLIGVVCGKVLLCFASGRAMSQSVQPLAEQSLLEGQQVFRKVAGVTYKRLSLLETKGGGRQQERNRGGSSGGWCVVDPLGRDLHGLLTTVSIYLLSKFLTRCRIKCLARHRPCLARALRARGTFKPYGSHLPRVVADVPCSRSHTPTRPPICALRYAEAARKRGGG